MSNKSLEPDKESSVANVNREFEGYGPKGSLFGEIPPPVILTPEPISHYPAGTHVLISGTCAANAKVELFVPLVGKIADALVVGTRWFFYRVWGPRTMGGRWNGWLGHPAGTWLFHAVQTVDGRVSAPSGTRMSVVGTLERSPVPVMTLPMDGHENLGPRIQMLGTCEAGARVDVAFNNEWYLGFGTEHEGTWYAPYRSPGDPPTVTIQVRQTVPGFLQSDPTELVTVRLVASIGDELGSNRFEDASMISSITPRKPPVPTIETPPKGKTYLELQEVLLSGSCEEGASVQLDFGEYGLRAGYVVGKKWYAYTTSPIDLGGSQQLRVRQSVGGGEHSDWSDTITITHELAPPLIVFPLPGSNHPVGGLFMSGVCDGDAIVEILNEGGDVLGNAAVKGTTWMFYREWAKGLHRVRAKQTYDGITPRPSELHEFIIR